MTGIRSDCTKMGGGGVLRRLFREAGRSQMAHTHKIGLYVIAWGIAWYSMVLNGVLLGILWCCMVVHIILWYSLVLH